MYPEFIYPALVQKYMVLNFQQYIYAYQCWWFSAHRQSVNI